MLTEEQLDSISRCLHAQRMRKQARANAEAARREAERLRRTTERIEGLKSKAKQGMEELKFYRAELKRKQSELEVARDELNVFEINPVGASAAGAVTITTSRAKVTRLEREIMQLKVKIEKAEYKVSSYIREKEYTEHGIT